MSGPVKFRQGLVDLHPISSEFVNNYFTDIRSGSEAVSYLRLINFVYHSILRLRVMTKRIKDNA